MKEQGRFVWNDVEDTPIHARHLPKRDAFFMRQIWPSEHSKTIKVQCDDRVYFPHWHRARQAHN